MVSMVIDRRAFLGLTAAAALCPAAASGAVPATRLLWLAANADVMRAYALGAFDAQGSKLFEIELPGRGHGITVSPDGRTAVLMARRPGTYGLAVDLASGRALRWFEAPSDRHFHGHGVYSGDGQRFYTTENDFDNGRGVIGVWDVAAGFRRVGEWSSHGIEPHDIRLMPDGRTLVVANGGIVTHPDSGRARLNLDEMDSSLVLMDGIDGALVGQWRLAPELRLLSIRHLSVNGAGQVAIGLQHQGPEDEPAPVFAIHDADRPLHLLDLPAPLVAPVRNYCGSIALDPTGQVAAASCPKGGLISLWDMGGRRFLASVPLADGCGVAAGPTPGSLVATSGRGGALAWSAQGSAQGTVPLPGEYLASRRWDNHAALAHSPRV